jgi:amino acid adenylation domain-containing protein
VHGRFQREPSPVEWIYAACQDWAPPLAIQVCVEGVGPLTCDALQEAVDRAAPACPGASLQWRAGRWVAGDVAPTVHDLSDEPGAVGALATFEALCAHPRVQRPLRTPCAEVLLWRGTETRLLFRVAHAAMDGQGCLQWVRQVFACLRGEAPTPHPDATTDWEVFQAQGRGRHAARPFSAPASLPVKGAFLAPPVVRRLSLPPGQPALVAKLAARLAQAAGRPWLRLMVPIDLRRHRPALRSCANLALPIFLDVAQGEPWLAIQGRLLRAMQANEELDAYATPGLRRLPAAVVGGLLWARGLASHATGRYLASALVSHVGKVPLSDLGAPAFEARRVCSLPVHTPFVPLSFVVLESDAGTEVTCSASLDAGQAAVLDALIAELGGPPGTLASPLVIEGAPSLVGSAGAAARFEGVWAAIARQCDAAPDAPAVLFQGRCIPYRELLAQVEALAAGCHRLGLEPGDRVAVVVDRHADALLSLLAALRLGAAFVPIDAAQPAGRIAKLVTESGARCCLVGSDAGRDALAPLVPCEVFTAEALKAARQGLAHAPPPREGPGDVVYVMYTSGSTSTPKGVPISQRNLVSYLGWAQDAYGVTPCTRFALVSSMAFDLAITAWLLPLVAGGSVAVMDAPFTPMGLRSFLADTEVNALKLTPSHLALIAREATEQLPAVQLVVVGGSQLFTSDAQAAVGCFGAGCNLFNEYGPTEATVGCVVHRFTGEEDGAVVPIGRPIAGMRLILRPTADAGVYELLLSGDGVAAGYTTDAPQAAAAFERLADGSLAYRTGDLVRQLPDGALAYWGRLGDALKVNGYRVDRGELEEALRGLPGVQGAHVALRVGGADRPDRLTAFVVLGATHSVGALRDALLAELPAYMVPHEFVRVEAIPLTANGKVDEAALRQAPRGVLAPAPAQVGWSEDEARVAAIWQRVLDLSERPAAQAHFFELGGDSLAFLRVLTALESLVGDAAPALQAAVQELLAQPTVADMAAVLKRVAAGAPAPSTAGQLTGGPS